MEAALTSALIEGVTSGRMPFWLIVAAALAYATLKASAKVGTASIKAVGYIGQMTASADKIAKSVEALARKTDELPSTIKHEHQLTRAEVEKVRVQVSSSQAALEKAIDADGDKTREVVSDHRTSVTAAKMGELAAVIEASVDEDPPPVRPALRSRPGRG